MRWFDNAPKLDDTRFISRFLFFPKKIDGETRWLEHAVYREQYSARGQYRMWIATNWVGEEPESWDE